MACSLSLLQLGLLDRTSTFAHTDVGQVDAAATTHDLMASEGVISKFDDYELIREIARGGMGVVYLARQVSLQRNVAVKLILAGQLATPESVQRFRREAEAAARLQHPGIVQIYDIGEFESQHYFSMEYIEGASLAECMNDFCLRRSGSRAERQARELTIAELIMKVAQAIDYAHQRGVLHRDIKPSNILLDEQGQPHLSDFGLAKLAGHERTSLTSIHAVMGTPGYLPPEQIAGTADQVTITSDVYSIGATLYELLTGRPPFVGATAFETMWMAAKEDVLPPRSLNPLISRDLETIALRCLEKKPEHRHPSAAALAEELQRFLRHEPILSRRVTYLESTWRTARRYPRSAALLVALLATLLIGTFISAWQWNRAEKSNQTLTESIEHLEWTAIDDLITQGESSRALAMVSRLLRDNPGNWKAAMFAMSMLEQKPFALPAAPTIRHASNMNLSVARLSQDGKLIVTACVDGTAQVWHAQNSTAAGEPMQHEGPVTWAEFHPAGSLVATCSRDGVTRLWDVATSLPSAIPYQIGEPVEKISFSQDGSRLLVQSSHKLAVLDGRTGLLILGPFIHSGKIVAARLLPDGRSFFCAEKNGERSKITVRETQRGEVTASLEPGDIRHADLSHDMRQVVVVTGQGSAWVADFPELKQKQSIAGSTMELQLAAFDPSGKLFSTVSKNLWVRVWSSQTALPVSDRLPHYYVIGGATFTKAGNRLITWSEDSLVNVWDLENGRRACEPLRHSNRVVFAEHDTCQSQELVLATLSHHGTFEVGQRLGSAQLWNIRPPQAASVKKLGIDPRTFDAVRFSPDGRYLVVGNTSQELRVYDAVTGEAVADPLPISGSAWGIVFTSDSQKLIITTNGGKIQYFSLPDGRQLREPIQLPQTIQSVETTADGKRFATASTDGFVRLWELDTGKLLLEISHGAGVNSLAFSPDGQQLASAGENHIVRIWDTDTGYLLRELTGHTNEVMKVAYSPDGRTIATSSLDFTARLWDAANGRLLHRMQHQGEVLDIAFSRDCKRVATGSRDRTAVLWDVLTGKPTAKELLHTQGVRNVQFHPHGPELLTCSFDGLRLWDSVSGNPLTVNIPQQLAAGTGFQSSSTCGAFSPDGNVVARGTDAYEAVMWRFSKTTQPAPDWFIDLLEAVAGQRMSAHDRQPQPVSSEVFLELKHRILGSNETDYYTVWAQRWLE